MRDTECHRWRTCTHGSPNGSGLPGCNYFYDTGKIRGGYPDECPYYEEKAKRGAGWLTKAITGERNDNR